MRIMKKPKEVTEAMKARAICKKIAYQVPDGNMERLLFAIFRQAVLDSYGTNGTPRSDLHEARAYLRLPVVPHLEVLGIETEWARSLFKKANVRAMQ